MYAREVRRTQFLSPSRSDSSRLHIRFHIPAFVVTPSAILATSACGIFGILIFADRLGLGWCRRGPARPNRLECAVTFWWRCYIYTINLGSPQPQPQPQQPRRLDYYHHHCTTSPSLCLEIVEIWLHTSKPLG